MLDIGNRIRELRLQRNISAKELAITLGVSQSFLSGIENGNKKCAIETLEKICIALDISLSAFFLSDMDDLSPDLLHLIETARKLTVEERLTLTTFLLTIKRDK